MSHYMDLVGEGLDSDVSGLEISAVAATKLFISEIGYASSPDSSDVYALTVR